MHHLCPVPPRPAQLMGARIDNRQRQREDDVIAMRVGGIQLDCCRVAARLVKAVRACASAAHLPTPLLFTSAIPPCLPALAHNR